MVIDDSILSISVIVGILAVLIIAGLLGGWRNNIYSLCYYIKNVYLSNEPQAIDEGKSEIEIAIEARVRNWEIYLPEEGMEWVEEIFYLPEGEIKTDISDLLNPYVPFSARLFKEYYSSVIEDGKFCEIELKIIDFKTKKERWRRKKTLPVQDESGKIIGIKGFLRRVAIR